jgi:hypothetical protein
VNHAVLPSWRAPSTEHQMLYASQFTIHNSQFTTHNTISRPDHHHSWVFSSIHIKINLVHPVSRLIAPGPGYIYTWQWHWHAILPPQRCDFSLSIPSSTLVVSLDLLHLPAPTVPSPGPYRRYSSGGGATWQRNRKQRWRL